MRKCHYAPLLFFVLFHLNVLAQPDDKRDSTTLICVFNPEPEFPGGKEVFNLFLAENLKFPKKNKCSGKILVAFLVNENGSISDARILKTFDASLDKRTLKAFNLMPLWTFPREQGKIVKVSYVVTLIISNARIQPIS